MFKEELLCENDFEAVLATFCCYDHGAKASEAVQMKTYNCQSEKQQVLYHSHKKRKDSLETRAMLLLFLFGLGITVVAVQSIHQNSTKW